MKNEPLFEFELDEKTNTIKVIRTFAAPLPLVWQAWTKAEILDQWWAPEGYKSSTKTMEFEEGGMRHYCMQGPGDFEMWGITSYTRIEWHLKFSGNEYSANEHAVISEELPPSDYQITFTDEGERTRIEHHTSYQNAEHMKQSLAYGFKEGMLGAFERLDEFFSEK